VYAGRALDIFTTRHPVPLSAAPGLMKMMQDRSLRSIARVIAIELLMRVRPGGSPAWARDLGLPRALIGVMGEGTPPSGTAFTALAALARHGPPVLDPEDYRRIRAIRRSAPPWLREDCDWLLKTEPASWHNGP
jgi:hypothetical protein